MYEIMERLEGIASLLSHKQSIKLMDTDVSAVHSVHYPLPHYRSQQGAGRRGSIRQQWTFVFLQ